jgi:uncharacterized membrane protein
MKRIHAKSENNNSVVMCIVIGLLVSLVVSVVFSAVLTSLIQKGKSDQANGLGVFAIRTIATLSGCLTGVVLSKKKPLVVIGIIALGFFVILLMAGLLLFGGAIKRIGNGALSVLLGGLVACVMELRPKKSPKRRYIKK